jgi:hypothetical protein
MTPRRCARLAALLFSAVAAQPLWAEQVTVTNPTTAPVQTISGSARLDFIINMGKFLFFSVGTGTYPTASATIDSVGFTLTPSIGGASPVTGNNMGVTWNGAAPTMTAVGSNNVLPVQVRSNGGQVSIRATADTLLTSGANVIPLSAISVTSSDANLPAPPIPATVTGAGVNVTGTAFSNLVTVRDSNWTFNFTPPASVAAGTYSGRILFTASSP